MRATKNGDEGRTRLLAARVAIVERCCEAAQMKMESDNVGQLVMRRREGFDYSRWREELSEKIGMLKKSVQSKIEATEGR